LVGLLWILFNSVAANYVENAWSFLRDILMPSLVAWIEYGWSTLREVFEFPAFSPNFRNGPVAQPMVVAR
jgi:hypothetical protein